MEQSIQFNIFEEVLNGIDKDWISKTSGETGFKEGSPWEGCVRVCLHAHAHTCVYKTCFECKNMETDVVPD